MKIYKCICEALDYGKNPNAIKDLKEILGSINDVIVKEPFYEGGSPAEGAGAGVIVEVSETSYSDVNDKVSELTAEKYGVNKSFYRLGLAIIEEI